MYIIFLGFAVREVGSSYNLTCPAKNKNDTYKFYKTGVTGAKTDVKTDANTQQFGHILAIRKVGWDDAGQYFCSAYDSNGNEVLSHRLVILTITRGIIFYITYSSIKKIYNLLFIHSHARVLIPPGDLLHPGILTEHSRVQSCPNSMS